MIPELPENFECLWEDCRVQFLSAHDFYCHTVGHVNNAKKSGKGVICAWEGEDLSLLRLNIYTNDICAYILDSFGRL